MEFKCHARRYIEILSKRGAEIAEHMRNYLADDSVFTVWALDDVRYVDYNVWQHLTPRLYPELGVKIDDIIGQFQGEDDKKADAIDNLFADFAHRKLVAPLPYESLEVESWLKMKLKDLELYDMLVSGRPSGWADKPQR